MMKIRLRRKKPIRAIQSYMFEAKAADGDNMLAKADHDEHSQNDDHLRSGKLTTLG